MAIDWQTNLSGLIVFRFVVISTIENTPCQSIKNSYNMLKLLDEVRVSEMIEAPIERIREKKKPGIRPKKPSVETGYP